MNRTNPFRTISIAVAVLLCAILLHAIGVLRPVESLLGAVLKPIAAIGGGSGNASREAELQAKVDQLTSELAKREEALRENEALRAELRFAQGNNYTLVNAVIISQDPTNYQQFLTINQGSSNGIQKGMAVVSRGLLVGRIIDTTTTTAKVYLITDYNSAVPAIDQQSRASGVVKGQRGFGLQLEMVPQTDQLKPGDTVITSGFGGDYPRGLVIGTIGEIKQKDAEVFQQAVIKPAVDFRKLETVFVITGAN